MLRNLSCFVLVFVVIVMSKLQWRNTPEAVRRVLSENIVAEGHTIRHITQLIQKQYHIPVAWDTSRLQKQVKTAITKALNQTVEKVSKQRYSIIRSTEQNNNNNLSTSSNDCSDVVAHNSDSDSESESKQEEKCHVLLDNTAGPRVRPRLIPRAMGRQYDDESNLSTIRKKYPTYFCFKPDLSDIIDDEETLPTLHIGNFVVPCENCHALHPYSERQGGSSLAKPKFNMCCKDGKVSLPLIRDPPAEVQKYYEGQDFYSKVFKGYLSHLNNSLAMGFVKMQYGQLQLRGPQFMRVNGHVTYYIGAMNPKDTNQPQYAQIWTVDDNEKAAELRTAIHPDFDVADGELSENKHKTRRVLKKMFEVCQTSLKENNPYVSQYLQAYDKITHSSNSAQAFILTEEKPAEEHKRRWNLPNKNEFAMVTPISDLRKGSRREIVMEYRDTGKLRNISHLSAHCEPLCYPLIHWYGAPGWSFGFKNVTGITELDYYRYYIFARADNFNLLHRSSRLFNQWLCDALAKIELNRLQHQFRSGKKGKRAKIGELQQAVQTGFAEHDWDDVTKDIKLKKTFHGSFAYFRNCYLDDMALARY